MAQRALITGGNAGLGLATAIALCAKGYEVLITVRSSEKGEAAVRSVHEKVAKASISFGVMDALSFSSVRTFASTVEGPLDVLILNAGVMNVPFALSEDGIESQLQVNHVAHFLVTHLLIPKLKDGARVITLASRAHLRWNQEMDLDVLSTKNTYDGWLSYGRSKTCNILFAKSLAKRFPNLRSNSLHPGLVDTGLLVAAKLSENTIKQARTIDEGIDTVVYLATHNAVKDVTGEYFSDREVVVPPDISRWAASDAAGDALWAASEKMCSIPPGTYGEP